MKIISALAITVATMGIAQADVVGTVSIPAKRTIHF